MADGKDQDEVLVSNNKRMEPMPELLRPVKKQKKEAEQDLRIEIVSKYIGNFRLNINLLYETFQVREIEEKHVDQLVSSMREYADEAYQPPCVHLIDVKREEFKDKQCNGYRYTILGGQHMIAACRILSKEDERFKTRHCTVYADLSFDAKMLLSALHNRTGEKRKSSSLKDKVKFAKGWCEKMAGQKTEKNSRLLCVDMLGMTNAEAEVVMALAGKEEELFESIIRLLMEWENGRLKGQKLTAKERSEGIIKVPWTKFKGAVKISDESLKILVDEVLQLDRDIKSFSKEADIIHKLSIVQRAFVQVTKCTGWEEAVQKFPEKTRRERLMPFIETSFKKGIPESFSSMLIKPKMVKETLHMKVFEKNDVRAVMRKDDAMDVTPESINEAFGEKTSIALTILDPDESWKEDDLKEFLVAYQNLLLDRQTGRSALVVLGSVDWISTETACLSRSTLFHKTEKLYIVNSFLKCTSAVTDCVDGAVVAFMTNDIQPTASLNFQVVKPMLNAIVIDKQEPREKLEGDEVVYGQKPLELMSRLIDHFTKKGDLIYCPCSGTGTVAVAALTAGRHSFSVEKNEAIFECAVNRIVKAIN